MQYPTANALEVSRKGLESRRLQGKSTNNFVSKNIIGGKMIWKTKKKTTSKEFIWFFDLYGFPEALNWEGPCSDWYELTVAKTVVFNKASTQQGYGQLRR